MKISAAAEAPSVSPETLREGDPRTEIPGLPCDPAARGGLEDHHRELVQAIRGLREHGRSFDSIRVSLELSASEVMAAAPVDVHADPRRRWLSATLLAASEAARSRSQALDGARHEIARLKDVVEALDARVSGLQVDNSHLQDALEAAEDRMQRTELIHAVRQIRPHGPWWRFW